MTSLCKTRAVKRTGNFTDFWLQCLEAGTVSSYSLGHNYLRLARMKYAIAPDLEEEQLLGTSQPHDCSHAVGVTAVLSNDSTFATAAYSRRHDFPLLSLNLNISGAAARSCQPVLAFFIDAQPDHLERSFAHRPTTCQVREKHFAKFNTALFRQRTS